MRASLTVELQVGRPASARSLPLAERVARARDRLQRRLQLRRQLALLDERAAQLVDDRRLLDPDRARLDARVALVARPHRLRPHAVASDDRGLRAPLARGQEAAEHAADALLRPQRVGLLAQLEDDVARGERLAGRVRGARLVALAALRAGVELQQVARREVGERRVAGGLRGALGRDHLEASSGLRIAQHERREARQHVRALRVRQRRDEGERDEPVRPPDGVAQHVERAPRERAERLRDRPPGGADGGLVGHVHRDPHALEQEAGQQQVQQPADEDPVADAVAAAVVLRIARRAVGPRVVELARTQHAATHHHRQHAGEEHDAEHVEHERVDDVEVAREEAPAEQRLGHVGVDPQHDRPGEQRQEAVEDRGVRDARVAVAARHRHVCGDDAQGVSQPRRQLARRRQAAAAAEAVLRQRPRDAVERARAPRRPRARTRGPPPTRGTARRPRACGPARPRATPSATRPRSGRSART